MIVERLMAIAPTAMGRSIPQGTRRTSGHGDSDEVIARRPDQVMDQVYVAWDRSICGACERATPGSDAAREGLDPNEGVSSRRPRGTIHMW